jgi:hypothetical protein
LVEKGSMSACLCSRYQNLWSSVEPHNGDLPSIPCLINCHSIFFTNHYTARCCNNCGNASLKAFGNNLRLDVSESLLAHLVKYFSDRLPRPLLDKFVGVKTVKT